MNLARRLYIYGPILLVIGLFIVVCFLPDLVAARNINQYKDTISDSAPNRASNHTLSFQIKTDVGPGGYIEVIPPAGFEVLGTSTFSAERNVELLVNGVRRVVGPVLSASDDLVDIIPGTPGMIRYTFNQTNGVSTDDKLTLKIGNHTSLANKFLVEYSTTTGTTTTIADIKPIINGGTIGTQKVLVSVYDGTEVASAGFLIGLVNRVGVGPIDTTEEIPPFRFNGLPNSPVSGTTLGVEVSLETDELAVCKFGTTPGIDFNSMGTTMTHTGMIFHTEVVSVVPDSVNTFYIRCIDDEGNYNIDDFIITFIVNPAPTGSSNEDGDVEGDGTGTGNNGSGSGGGGGGTSGSSDGQEPQTGGSSGSGGAGGGSGGGAGGSTGNSGGGGFETTDGPYRSGDGQVLITGYAPARSKVTAIVDGHFGGEATANADGAYSITIKKIARGAYTFGVYATDGNKVKTSTISTSFTVTGARESALSNINIAPSLKVTPDPVTAGQPLTLSGTAMPNSTVTVENEREGSAVSRKSFTILAGANGVWTIPVDTSSFGNGTYKARVKSVSTSPSVNTNFSDYVLYGVGQNADRPLSSDLNVDGKVNLVDFSILLFWWNSDGGNSNPPADINRDKKVNLTDFSILLFNWTG